MQTINEVRLFVRKVDPSSHLILFYNDPESKRAVLFDFLSDGLEKGKGVVYVCSDESPEQVRRGMDSYGIDVEANEKAGNLMVVDYDGWYIEGGRVETLRIIARWKEIYERFKERGLGMRATGETTCFFENDMVRELLRYEYALHKILNIPMEAICAYNLQTIVNTGYTDIIMPLIRAHKKAIFTAHGYSMVLEPENVEETDIERLLEIRI